MDANEARSIFDRENYSSVLLRPESNAAREEIIRQLDADKRFKLRGSAGSGLLSRSRPAR